VVYQPATERGGKGSARRVVKWCLDISALDDLSCRVMAIHHIDIFPESKISALLSGNDSSSVSSYRKNTGVLRRTTRRWMPLHQNIALAWVKSLIKRCVALISCNSLPRKMNWSLSWFCLKFII